MKSGLRPVFTALHSPKPIAQAAKSELRYFSIWPLTSQDVLNTSVANSCPLPNSAASFSVFRRGFVKVVLSLLSRQIFATVLAVAISVWYAFPNPISFSRMLAGISLVSDLGERHRHFKIINALRIGLPAPIPHFHRMAGGMYGGVGDGLDAAGGQAFHNQAQQPVVGCGRIIRKL